MPDVASNASKGGIVRSTKRTHGGRKATQIRQKRVALTVPEAVDFNVELCALQEGRVKNEVMVEALRAYLKGKKMEPDLYPTISYTS